MPRRILVRCTNWVGDAVMSLPALREIRRHFSGDHLTLLCFSGIADLYGRETLADEVIPFRTKRGWRDFGSKRLLAGRLREGRYDHAVLLTNSFESAALVWMAGIPERTGYSRDGRRLLLTKPVRRPGKGEIPRFEAFYYLEMLRRLGWLAALPAEATIRLDGMDAARRDGAAKLASVGLAGPVVGISPGAAYGTAKRWLPERFAETAATLHRITGGPVAIFGTPDERDLCSSVLAMLESAGVPAKNLAGETSLRDFIDMAAACRVFVTNDSGSMHIASAAGTPTVAVFGATDAAATGPTGANARVVQGVASCSPCLLRECPIDHRCMVSVTSERVALEAVSLLK